MKNAEIIRAAAESHGNTKAQATAKAWLALPGLDRRGRVTTERLVSKLGPQYQEGAQALGLS